MKAQRFFIEGIPCVLYGENQPKGYLFVHGQCGCKEEASPFAEIAVPEGFQVMGMDLPEHGERKVQTDGFNPWTVVPELKMVMIDLKKRWNQILIRANSIGAYFSMLAFADEKIEKALFVSPIVDMPRLIRDMMAWAGVTENSLRSQGEIVTNFGQTLSWRYLCWAREHPITGWHAPTSVLYAGQDHLTSKDTIQAFADANDASLEIDESGEHWFHTPEQLQSLHAWEQRNL